MAAAERLFCWEKEGALLWRVNIMNGETWKRGELAVIIAERPKNKGGGADASSEAVKPGVF